ncbi:MAG: hypothetical protein AAF267_07460 [Deinococcota bacterium]
MALEPSVIGCLLLLEVLLLALIGSMEAATDEREETLAKKITAFWTMLLMGTLRSVAFYLTLFYFLFTYTLETVHGITDITFESGNVYDVEQHLVLWQNIANYAVTRGLWVTLLGLVLGYALLIHTRQLLIPKVKFPQYVTNSIATASTILICLVAVIVRQTQAHDISMQDLLLALVGVKFVLETLEYYVRFVIPSRVL